ncbi:carboxylating nicotinate-nucleotide diphosphorylase [Nitrososphaera viennensis]|uniref:Nicotinate-nucleotide pyrophosphorylase [carboxylating] n=2 Tax=Nitrososphaera viennensis TaxID=1034015 RepID=A0A060HLV6_9ARCH|nr:carboxylating nicotinate-nucleotide diphosphorylase [Nitrososphaera viennensis]AIC14566.1 nicotinate-nucleotide pyrophosphorylase [Nitrososphaera viennensis EN76]UVS69535.1 carboxylating nicotinate-nucleotide diphosphorylase [Nitrososphaera viennensis]
MSSLDTFLDVRQALVSFIQEDAGTGDITSDTTIPAGMNARAEIVCKTDNCIVCGLEEAGIIFDICGCSARALVKDGAKVSKSKTVMIIKGNARAILKAERVALNLVMRMSGIATETRALADKARPVKIAATRKTAPGLRYFDKKAVVLGGGLAHRMRLDDMVLIKDNHIALAGAPDKCVSLARKGAGTAIKVECEAKSEKEAIAAIKAGADIVMLDNFTPAQAAKAIKNIARLGLRKKATIEISGGVNHKNIRQYAKARPDYVSMGYITHSPKAADFSLEIIKTKITKS